MIATGAVRFSLLAVALSASAQSLTAQNGQVDGLVRDSLGIGVPGAEVLVVETGARTGTDNAGKFTFRGLPDSGVTLEARKAGYRPTSVVVELRAGTIGTTIMVLLPDDPALPGAAAGLGAGVGRPDRYRNTTRYDDFFRRQRSGTGAFITREQIDRMRAFNTFELIREIPGVQAQPGGVVFPRCGGASDNVAVFIDGERQRPSAGAVGRGTGAAVAEMLSRVSAPQVEMMEVYRGLSELPAEFRENACAAIAIWTRPTLVPRDTTRIVPRDTIRRPR
jgi:hypothetical protein